ncbi:class E vacuolar protein-sorting machinery protein HSE1-like, partial [Lagopus leucura]|uniref:class E vacuolar protein-sorting machinery protein HSE1-like n=1 Tax=Lagopus leucura TaxID=30410 RepID=UPI001C6662AB
MGPGGQRPIAAPHQQPLCAPQMAAARLKFDFRAESPRELSLSRGDVVLLHGAVDANWLRGEHGGRVGIFPRTYVEVLPHGEAPQPGTPAAAQGCATAVFSFHGELPVELSFRRVSVAGRVMACYGVLWHVMVCYGMLLRVTGCYGMLWHVTACNGVLWRVMVCYGVLWRVISCHIVPYRAILCHIVPYRAISCHI